MSCQRLYTLDIMVSAPSPQEITPQITPVNQASEISSQETTNARDARDNGPILRKKLRHCQRMPGWQRFSRRSCGLALFRKRPGATLVVLLCRQDQGQPYFRNWILGKWRRNLVAGADDRARAILG